MQVGFFDDHLASNFLPLTLTRPLVELRTGIFTIKEKWEKHLSPTKLTGVFPSHLHLLFVRDSIDMEEPCVWINSRLLPSKKLVPEILKLRFNSYLMKDGVVLAAYLDGVKSRQIFEKNNWIDFELPKIETNTSLPNLITYPWDLLTNNGNEIVNDLSLLSISNFPSLKTELSKNIIASKPKEIFISEGAVVEPGCILIAEKGPIYVGSEAVIEAGSIIKGPVAVCEKATVKMAARICDSTTIGPVCKVGGEVSNSIFHSYSNKGHDGFVGNSIFGQWCNLGADTNTSNLKNNYSKVHLAKWNLNEVFDEGVQFLGTIMGDHSKTSINTMLNTGTVCGVCTNVFLSGFPPKSIPSFKWMSDSGTEIYDFEKAVLAMKAMMARRNVPLTEGYEKMMRSIFDDS